jgi:predicted ATPase
MIRRLYVHNFKCFVDFTLDLGPRQVIVGDNGSGKSTLLEVLSALRRFAIDGDHAVDRFAASTRTRWRKPGGQRFELDVELAGDLFEYHLELEPTGPKDESHVTDERVTWNGRPLFRFANEQVQLFDDKHEQIAAYPFGGQRSALAVISERPDNLKVTAFKHYLGSVLCAQVNPRAMPAMAETEDETLERYCQNFAAWYRHAQAEDPRAASELHTDLRKVLPGFDSIILKSMGENRRLLLVRFVTRDAERTSPTTEYSFGDLSDGQRALIALYALLRFSIQRGHTVCIDEPDNYLALCEIEPWLNEVLDTVDDGDGQVLIVTHHPEIIDRTVLEMGIQLTRDGLEPVHAAPYQQPVDSHISPSERMARGWTSE